MKILDDLKIKIFADGANIEFIKEYSKKNFISGFTTNPTLMKKAGVTNYLNFCEKAIKIVENKEISFEVFADHLEDMETQPINLIFTLATFLPGLAVSVRRLHDVNRSGWWLLITFTFIGLCFFWFF